MFDVTTWTAHASREPQASFLKLLDQRWRQCPSLSDADCVWHQSPVHALVLVHADRATHRRRIRTQYFGEGTCELINEGHGFRPMSDLMPHDQYGPELLDVVHTGEESPLAAALVAAKADPNLAAVTVFNENQFVGVDSYLDHAATELRPEVHGAVIPFIALGKCDDSRAQEVQDLLHVNGYTSYRVQLASNAEDPLTLHRELALVMEDVLDAIAQIKADAGERILLSNPRWPVIMLCGSL